jgi:hypothetical protein
VAIDLGHRAGKGPRPGQAAGGVWLSLSSIAWSSNVRPS